MKLKDKTIALIITILSILLIGTLELSHLYWGSNLIFIIGIPIYLILLEQYTKNQQKKICLDYNWNKFRLECYCFKQFISTNIYNFFVLYILFKKKKI